MPRALVLGANGQDGTFLVRHLLEDGHDVVGVGRQPESRFLHGPRYVYHRCDLADIGAVEQLLQRTDPEWVFHFAAVHGSAETNHYEGCFGSMLAVNVASVHAVLEHARLRRPGLRLLYAASAKCFGEPLPSRIDETKPRVGSCLYGISKNAAVDLIDYYRRRHGIAGGSVYLFNHESEFRRSQFFIPRLVKAIVDARRGRQEKTTFRTLDFSCDWGVAEEYMRLAVDLMDQAPGQDFVMATGVTRRAEVVVSESFARFGLRADDHVTSRPAPTVDVPYVVLTQKLRDTLGRVPERKIEDLIDAMVVQAEESANP